MSSKPWLLLIIVGLLSHFPLVRGQDPDAEIQEMQSKIRELEERINSGDGGTNTAADPGAARYLTRLKSYFDLYGFIRVDAIYDDSRMNDPQIAIFAVSEDQRVGFDEQDDDFTIHTRLTRLGLNFEGPPIADAKLTGKIEVDFYGFLNSDSRNDLRMRHAYLQVAEEDWTLLGGQTSDLVSPLYPAVNPDLINWLAGNTGDRRPQLRASYHPELGKGRLYLQGALALQGAIDRGNLDGDGVLDGEDSGLPQLQGRIAYRMPTPLSDSASMEIGVWGARGWEETDAPINGDGEFTVSLWGFDLTLPLLSDRLWLEGEYWRGKNLDDLRGGIGQGINATTGEEIHADGGWLELGAKVADWSTVSVGYSIDNPSRREVAFSNGTSLGGLTQNKQLYIGTRFDPWKPVVFGLDYVYWDTNHRGLRDGDDNRFRFYLQYNF